MEDDDRGGVKKESLIELYEQINDDVLLKAYAEGVPHPFEEAASRMGKGWFHAIPEAAQENMYNEAILAANEVLTDDK